MRTLIQLWWSNTLFSRQAAHNMTFRYEKTLGILQPVRAIHVFPSYGVKFVVSDDQQDACRLSFKCVPSRCFKRKKGAKDGFAISYWVIKWLWSIFLCIWDESE